MSTFVRLIYGNDDRLSPGLLNDQTAAELCARDIAHFIAQATVKVDADA